MAQHRPSATSAWYERRPALAAGIVLAGLAALFYLPLLLGLRTFLDGDFTHHFLPFSLFQHEALRTLTLPLWNPYTYSGHPFWADIQSAATYPLSNALLLLTLPFDEAGARLYWLQVEAIGQTALGGFFLYLLLTDLTRVPWAALTGAVAFMLSGYLTAYPPLQLAVLRTAIWLPLLLWLVWRAFAASTMWRWWIGAGIAYAVAFSAGHPQTFLHISYTTAAWFLFLWISASRRGLTTWRQPLVGGALLALVAAGLSAAQLLPSLEFTGLSVRADVSYAYVSGGLPPRDTWQMFLPSILTYYSPLYVGAAGLGLAILGLGALTSGRYGATDTASQPASPRALIAFFGTLALVGLLLSYGGNGFLYPLFYSIAPGWNLFRGQERTAYLVALALSVLAGFGAAAVPVMGVRLRQRLALFYGATLTALTYIFGLFWQFFGETAISNARYLVIAAITLFFGIGVALLVWLPGWNRRRAALVVALTAANLFVVNFGLNFSPFGPARMVILAPEMEALGAAVAEQSEANLGLPGRVYNEFRIYEDYGMRQQVEDVWGASPLRLDRYAQLFDHFPLDRMWDLTGVTHVLTWRGELFEPSERLGAFPQAEDTTYLHRLRDANPRAWLAADVERAKDDQVLGLLADHQFDLRRTALLAPDSLPGAETLAPADTDAALITLTRLAHNRLQVDVTGPGGLLIISENWMPGWRVRQAQCDGEACPASGVNGVPLLKPARVHLTFVGVALPSGAVRFELVYAPTSVGIGLALTLLTLTVLLLVGGVHWRRTRRTA